MSSIYVLLPIGLLMSVLAVLWFVWAVRSGQFDDLDTPAMRVLFDEEKFESEETEHDGTTKG